MKKLFENHNLRKVLYFLLVFAIFLFILDFLLLPWYVTSPETKVPKITGLKESEAVALIKSSDLEPVISDTTFDELIPKGSVILQKPGAGDIVKKGRRVYIFISSGEPIVNVPLLKGRSVKDAKLSLERVGLLLGNISAVPSSNPKDIIFDQQYTAGTPLKKGDAVGITISSGEIQEGEITVPDLIGKSLMEAEKVIADSTLKLGKINYQKSFSLLPNTILDQYPSKGTKVSTGTQIDLFVTKSGEEKKEIIEQ